MSSPSPAATSSPATTASNAPVDCECHFFDCGHGDTILLRLPGDKWVLVDCNLVVDDGTHAAFFQFLQQRNINRLEYVVLTHPDIDHFRGMVDVLDYFTTNGRTVGALCDSNLTSQLVRGLIDSTSTRFFDKLQKKITDLDQSDLISYHPIDKHGVEIGPEGYEGRVDLIPIAPDPGKIRRQVVAEVPKLLGNPSAALQSNSLSVILVLCLHDRGQRFHLLLGADPESDGMRIALGTWEERANGSNRPPTFDSVKVPHHGSPHSHCTELTEKGTPGKTKIAVVSAGLRSKLPARTVLQDYLTKNWKVLITTTRHGRRRARSAASLATIRKPTSSRRHSIELKWSVASGLQWSPPQAEITAADMTNYDS